MWNWLLGPNLAKKAPLLSTYADALSYSFVLSVIPFVVIAFALTSEFVGSLSPRTYESTLSSVLPLDNGNRTDLHLANRISTALETQRNSGIARTIGLLFAIYTSYNLMNQIVRSLLFIFDDARRAFEWTWGIFTKTLALLAIWTFLLLAVTVSSVLGIFLYHNAHFLSASWRVASNLGLIASLFFAVFATYYLVPGRRPRLRAARDGAMVASLGWIGCSLIFTRVLPHMMGMNLVYQALGSIVIILLWAQACAWSLIIGACWMVRFKSKR